MKFYFMESGIYDTKRNFLLQDCICYCLFIVLKNFVCLKSRSYNLELSNLLYYEKGLPCVNATDMDLSLVSIGRQRWQ